jgi:hypothetical protein
MEHWLAQWSKMMSSARNLQDFPLWLQYFPKIIFLVINKSGESSKSAVLTWNIYRSFEQSRWSKNIMGEPVWPHVTVQLFHRAPFRTSNGQAT